MPPEKRRRRDANGTDNSDSSSGAEGAFKDLCAQLRTRINDSICDGAPNTSQNSDERRSRLTTRLAISTQLSRLCEEICAPPSPRSIEAAPSTSADPLSIINLIVSTPSRVPSSSIETSSRSQDRSAIESRNNPVTPSTVYSTAVMPQRLSSAVSVLTRSRDRLPRGRPSEASTSQSVERYRRGAHTDRRHDRRHERSRRQNTSRDFRQRSALGNRSSGSSHRDCPISLVNSLNVASSSAPAASSSTNRNYLSAETLHSPVNQNQGTQPVSEGHAITDSHAISRVEDVVNAEASGIEYALMDDDDAFEEISDDELLNEANQEPEGAEDLNKRILTTVECPVCFDLMSPPMAQCRRGHLVCSVCRQRLNLCPTCRAPFTNRRNLYVERITEMLRYPCRHAGCLSRVDLNLRYEHEANCRLRPRNCALARSNTTISTTCNLPRSVPMLLRHYRIHHADAILVGPVQQVRVWLLQHDWIIIAHRRMFHLNITTNTHMLASVQYYGQQQKCSDFLYTVELSCAGPVARSYHYTRRVHSDLTTVPELHRSHDIFSLSSAATKLFEQSHNGDLEVHVEILDIRPDRSGDKGQNETRDDKDAESANGMDAGDDLSRIAERGSVG